MTDDMLATLACRKLKVDKVKKIKYKLPDCSCDPCQARLRVFGENLNVVQQETRRVEWKSSQVTEVAQEPKVKSGTQSQGKVL